MRRSRGFTLVEVLIVTAIATLLLALLLPIIGGARRRMAEGTCLSNLHMIAQAAAQYRQDQLVYPGPPDRQNLMLALVNNHYLDTIRHCPRGPKSQLDSYSALYNYYGYHRDTSPRSIDKFSDVEGVYQNLVNPKTGVKDFWYASELDASAVGPGPNFPGMINSEAPGNTIITVCPLHTDRGVYTLVRVDGTAEAVRVPDDLFWTLSKPTGD
jgi:prepilin-type N-terminal cleavage/methylation domain-containing protein